MKKTTQSVLLSLTLASLISCTADDPKLQVHFNDVSGQVLEGNGTTIRGLIATCATTSVVVKMGESRDLSWNMEGEIGDASFTFALSKQTETPGELGSITILDEKTVRYTAPPAASSLGGFDIQVVARAEEKGIESPCAVRVQREVDLGLPDDGFTEGLRGNVYWVSDKIERLPDFSMMTPKFALVTPNLNIPERGWEVGFPGVGEQRFEWFGIRYDAQILIEESGSYDFRISSDDGSLLWVDDELIINNDGRHETLAKDSRDLLLSAGPHKIRVDYFQGPRNHIALQLFWRRTGIGRFEIIPSSVFRRPEDPTKKVVLPISASDSF